MEIIRPTARNTEKTLQRSRVARLFKPTEEESREFLRTAQETHLGIATAKLLEKPLRIELALCVAAKGETLTAISQKIRAEGWSFGTIIDWYHYLRSGGICDSTYIFLPSEVYRDDQLREWIPRIQYYPKSMRTGPKGRIFRKSSRDKKSRRHTIAELSMKQLRIHAPFQSETSLLLVKIDREEKKYGNKI